MKKVLTCAALVLLMSSCYNAKVCVGKMKKNDPAVKVNSVTNHNLLFGLIPIGNNEVDAKTYIGERENYAVSYNMSFVNGLLGGITMGIYTPMTTSFYVPLEEITKK